MPVRSHPARSNNATHRAYMQVTPRSRYRNVTHVPRRNGHLCPETSPIVVQASRLHSEARKMQYDTHKQRCQTTSLLHVIRVKPLRLHLGPPSCPEILTFQLVHFLGSAPQLLLELGRSQTDANISCAENYHNYNGQRIHGQRISGCIYRKRSVVCQAALIPRDVDSSYTYCCGPRQIRWGHHVLVHVNGRLASAQILNRRIPIDPHLRSISKFFRRPKCNRHNIIDVCR